MNRCLRLTSLMMWAAITALHAGQEGLPAPAQRPTFKAEVEYVEVDAIVTDGRGQTIRDLSKEDVQVFDDGKPQEISSFTLIDLAVEPHEQPLFAGQPIESDVIANTRRFDGRVYVMVIDDLHINVMRTQLVTKAVKQFIQNNLGANDLMAVVHTSGAVDASQEFTTNRRLLLAAVDRTIGGKLQAETLSRNELYLQTKDITRTGDQNVGASRSAIESMFDPNDVQRAHQARSTLEFLEKVANWFAGVRGRRKSILFVSEGIDYNIYDVMGNGFLPNNFVSNAHSGSTIVADAIRDVITAATRANVSIYGIDPRGLTSLADDAVTIQSFASADAHDPKLGIGPASLMNEVQLSQDSLRALSEETGGFAVVNRNHFADAYQRIVEDNSSYYEIGYSAPIEKRDGKYHKIEVRVNRPGLTVRARKGWMAPKGTPLLPPVTGDRATIAVREAVNNLLPISNLRLQMFAAPFKGSGANAAVLIGTELLGRDMKIATGDKLKMLYVAVDARDKVRSRSASVTLNLKPETQAIAQQGAVRLIGRLDLPPGRYQIRYAVHESGADVVGSVRYDLEVPDFTTKPLAMSGIALTSAASSGMPTIMIDDERLPTVLPGPPTAMRIFSQDDEIALFVEMYDNQPSKRSDVEVLTTIIDGTGVVQFETSEIRDTDDLPRRFGYTTRIPLQELGTGTYVLRVAARAEFGTAAPSVRQIPFAITAAAPAELQR